MESLDCAAPRAALPGRRRLAHGHLRVRGEALCAWARLCGFRSAPDRTRTMCVVRLNPQSTKMNCHPHCGFLPEKALATSVCDFGVVCYPIIGACHAEAPSPPQNVIVRKSTNMNCHPHRGFLPEKELATSSCDFRDFGMVCCPIRRLPRRDFSHALLSRPSQRRNKQQVTYDT